MNMTRNVGRGIGGVAARRNQVPPEVSAAVMEMSINPGGLTDGEVMNAFLQMAHAITTQAQDITAQATREGVTRENPHVITMASRLRDITRMNPPSVLRIQDP
ncbi:hypothetical protein EJD97_011023 [Solanum chilense]|uniref:Uncharacterized protein n=1 Tax=Solanum chilense TaxID=4083 RepID=A0A6N2C924_SOLCI|nr:hypothetical protein EJD97_011023 [Solanum chilense]